MAWRRPKLPPARIEYPECVQNFHPEDWDTPDGQELHMMAGHGGYPWPAELHEIHARRRWGEAKYEWFRDNPAAGEQRFRDIVEGYHYRRQHEPRPLD